jgi:DNA-binding IclR family transcriptional regulator
VVTENLGPTARVLTKSMSRRPPVPYVRVIGKALAVLDALAECSEDMSIADVSRTAGVNRTTAYRILATLEQELVVRRTEAGRYRLGFKALKFGNAAQRDVEIRRIALPHMQQLADELRLSTFLSMRDGDRSICVERVDRGPVLITTYRAGTTLPLTVGGGPFILLAARPDHEVNRLLADGVPELTTHTIIEGADVRSRLERARAEGIVWSDEDVAISMAAVACPVLSSEGHTIAALSLSSLRQTLMVDEREVSLRSMLRTAEVISREIGYVGPWPRLPLPAEPPVLPVGLIS